MMVTLLLYAYCIGVRSSREIERRCREDIALRFMAANCCPDRATIARFRADNDELLAGLFVQALRICSRPDRTRRPEEHGTRRPSRRSQRAVLRGLILDARHAPRSSQAIDGVAQTRRPAREPHRRQPFWQLTG
jgi:hypothetical protein